MNMPSIVLAVLMTLLLAGCQTSGSKGQGLTRNPGDSFLQEGIEDYEEGNYRTAKRRLQFALEEGLSRADRVKAHKYLAFIGCVSSQQLACREEFAVALELDPTFELSPAEAGHPIWGPVFKSLKTKQTKQP
jgi:Tfp pilus assembly protein PilF